jgi:hypothetical protein
MICSICGKRPARRFCPAKGEKICALCCGTGREVAINCPLDCPYLIAAHRYEAEHRQPLAPEDFPYKEVEIPVQFVYEHWPVISGIAGAMVSFQAQNQDLNDAAAHRALEALAETYRTLGTGIYYERPPDAPAARALYGHLAEFLAEFRQRETNRTGFSSLRDSDLFRILVFLLQMHKAETNGRPLSRSFLSLLREQSNAPASNSNEESRIIVP